MDRRTKRRKVGDIGEEIASSFLQGKGFCILERNYLQKFGEIDIISSKDGKLYFAEVKTVSRETAERGVSRETDEFRPEDNIDSKKIERMNRAIQVYLEETDFDGDWEIIGVMVELDKVKRIARVRLLTDFAW